MKGKYDFSVFFCVVSSLCITSNNFKNEDTVKLGSLWFLRFVYKEGGKRHFIFVKGMSASKVLAVFRLHRTV